MKTALALATLLVACSQLSFSQDQVTDWGRITQLRAGWVEDSMAVFLTAPVKNTGCKTTDAGYATNPSDPGHKLFHATLLGAYLNNKQVQVILRGCIYDKPRIIAVYVKD